MTNSLLKSLTITTSKQPRKIAFQQSPSAKTSKKPSLFWLNGFRSNMTSNKSREVNTWATQNGLAMTSFDYSGHGQSSGAFKDGTISQWLEESAEVFNTQTTGSQVIIGSSMGGWMALLLLKQHLKSLKAGEKSRIKGIALIAPAFNMTHDLIWQKMDDDIRSIIEKQGYWMKPSQYEEESFPITKALIDDGSHHLIQETFAPHCPIRIIQGMEDQVVPWQHSIKLMHHLNEPDISFNLIKDAGHRLSRPEDIKRLIQLIAEMI